MNPRRPSLDHLARTIWQAGVTGANARQLVADQVQVVDQLLDIAGLQIAPGNIRQIGIVGGGKAALPMAEGLLETLAPWATSNRVNVKGLINIPEVQNQIRIPDIDCRQVRPASFNYPTNQAVQATRDMRKLAASLQPHDLCLAIISGGCSALISDPVEGLSLDDLVATTQQLESFGANIQELNTVRQCLDQAKAGGLFRDCNASQMISLILSDVIGNDPLVIGSGPTMDCVCDYQAARDIIDRLGCAAQLPLRVIEYLDRFRTNMVPAMSSPSTQTDFRLLGGPETARDAAARSARRTPFQVICEDLDPDEKLPEKARLLTQKLIECKSPTCIVSSGEPTLHLAPRNQRGVGGRNQHFVLAMLQHWQAIAGNDPRSFCFLSGGTDGEDGITNAAGAWGTRATLKFADRRQIDLNSILDRNDSGTFFREAGSWLPAQSTETNVCDLRILLVD